MTGKRHLQLGTVMALTGYAALTQYYGVREAGLFGIGCIIGSVFPDIDLPNTKISKRIPGIPKLLNALFGHRGFIHTPVFMLLIDLLLYFGLSKNIHMILFIAGFDFGFLAHLIQDMFNQKGIMFLWPIKKRFRFMKTKCGNKSDLPITVCLGFLWLFCVPFLSTVIISAQTVLEKISVL